MYEIYFRFFKPIDPIWPYFRLKERKANLLAPTPTEKKHPMLHDSQRLIIEM